MVHQRTFQYFWIYQKDMSTAFLKKTSTQIRVTTNQHYRLHIDNQNGIVLSKTVVVLVVVERHTKYKVLDPAVRDDTWLAAIALDVV